MSRDGLLFLFLGNGRVHLFGHGHLLASHRKMTWYSHSRELMRNASRELSERHGVPQSTILEVLRLAYLISDQEKGALIALGDDERVLTLARRSDSDGYAWRPMNLRQKADAAIVGLMSQDKATIIAADGDVRCGRVALQPPEDVVTVEETGKGTRHGTAAVMSAATNAICIAVSDDGEISVYSGGELAYRTVI